MKVLARRWKGGKGVRNLFSVAYGDLAEKIKARYEGLLDRVSLYRHIQPALDDPRLAALIKAFNS
jgi:hypothetical protein